MFLQASKVEVGLPAWLELFGQTYTKSSDIKKRMLFVIAASQKNIQMQTGGPFAAAIFEANSGKLISLGVNLVTNQGLSVLHAEIVAITLAQRKLGSFDLSGHSSLDYELVTSTEPCAMCLGSIPWAGIRRVITGASDSDAREIGFDEGDKPDDWVGGLSLRGIEVINNIQRDEARSVLKSYLEANGKIYNPDVS